MAGLWVWWSEGEQNTLWVFTSLEWTKGQQQSVEDWRYCFNFIFLSLPCTYIVYLTYVCGIASYTLSMSRFGIHMRRLASYLKYFYYAPPPHGFHAKNTCCMPKVSLYCFTVHLTVLILRYEKIASLYGLFEIVHYKRKSTCKLHLPLPLLSSGSARFAIR